MKMYLRLLTILLVVLCPCASAQESIDAFAALGIEENAVTRWFATENLLPTSIVAAAPSEQIPCASYLISPHIIISQSGCSDLVSHRCADDLSDSDIMSMYGRLMDYVRLNAAAIYASGYLDDGKSYDILMIARLNDSSSYTGIYNILTEEFSIEYKQAA